jgi:hypothetical protein
MKKLIIALCLCATPAAAQINCQTFGTYTTCQDYGANNTANAILLAERNREEFIINQQRAQRGQPPCSLAPLGFLIGKTHC